MKRVTFFIILCFTISLCGEATLAQQTRAAQGQSEQAKPRSPSGAKPVAQQSRSDVVKQAQTKERLSARVIDILRSTAEEARGWNDAAAAANVQAQVAELTWEVDADAARGILVRAWETTSRVEEAKKERSRFRNYPVKTGARQEVMIVAGKRAPDLAKKWLEQMAQEAEAGQDGSERGAFDDRTARSTVLLQMAMGAVADNPKAAAQLTIESLQDGVSFGFQDVLIGLQAKDAELAQSVFRAALARLRTRGLGVVSTYGRFDDLMALEALTDAVKLMNKNSSAPVNDERAPSAAKFSGFTLPDFTYGTSGFGLRAAVEAFDASEFESVLGVLSKISRPEMRGVAVITLCRKHLRPNAKARVA